MSAIRIITEPSVRLVGHQVVDQSELDAFLRDEGAEGWTTDTEVGAQMLAEVAGRLCYKSYAKPRPGGNSTYLGHILEVGHGSVIEHAVYSFIITGVSRSFSHELVRHRAGMSYSQRSQRFCDERDTAVVEPPLIGEARKIADDYCREHGVDRGLVARCHIDAPELVWAAAASVEDWDRAIPFALDFYGRLSAYLARFVEIGDPSLDRTPARKKAREAARSVLPNATETQIFVTANARSLRHFIEARGDEAADAEIRAVAMKLLAILQAHSPNLFGDYATREVPGVGPVASTPHRKV